jgi:putative hydrolase of the HAD superfamily
VDVLLFDLDDTLVVEEDTAMRSFETALTLLPDLDPVAAAPIARAEARRIWHGGPYYDECRRLGIASSEGLWAEFTGCHPCLAPVAVWSVRHRQDAWSSIAAAVGRDGSSRLASAMAECFIEAQRAGHALIDGVGEVVRILAEDTMLGLVTNGPADIQRHKLARTGIEHCFATVTISGELGAGKPDARVFDTALRAMGVAHRDQVWMVGDSWERDIEGATNAGLQAVWINPAGDTAPEEGVPTLASVAGLPELLGR